ncbi:MAG TPA: hypothetical protein PLV83_04655 [Bacilli bacterium]|nr:hypothetical protein [Bacilli bacterium]
MNIEEQVRNIIEKSILEENYKLDEVIYEKEGRTYFLRIVIDKDGIVDVEDTVKVFHIVSKLLDVNDPIKDSYVLDVCSKEKGRE